MCDQCLNKIPLIIFLLILTFFSFINEKLKLLKTETNSPTTIITKITPTVTFQSKITNLEKVKVIRVIDGDTIEIENKKKVRYIGINTPEISDKRKTISCFGQEAFLKNKQLVEGKEIYLKKDVSETDKYNRLLRYIFLSEKETTDEANFVNLFLIANGYANLMTVPPDVKYEEIFRIAQKNAREKKLGLWNMCYENH